MTEETTMSQTPQTGDLDTAFEALKQVKVGDNLPAMAGPIDQAVMAVHGNPASRAALEKRLVTVLAASYPPLARSYACRQLALIGTPASVPALAALLVEDEELSVFARNALEHIPGPESEKALRDAIGKATGRTRIGLINSVAARRDALSVPILVKTLGEDPDSAAAAAKALGEIGTLEAAKALATARGKGPAKVQAAVVDGTFICVDRLIAAGQRSQAVSLLEPLTNSSQPANVRTAASRMLSATQRP